MTCPKCKTDQAHRSHREGWRDFAASILEYYPYRCKDCGYRFLKFRYKRPHITEKPTSAEAEIRVTRASQRWKRKRREVLLYGLALLFFAVVFYYLSRDSGGSAMG